VDDRHDVVFEHFARAQARHGNVLHSIIRVNRSLLLERSAEVLDGIVAGFYDGAIGLDDADVVHCNAFVGGVIADLNLAPLLNSGLTLHADASGGFLAASAVVFKVVKRSVLLDDEGFLGVIVLGFVGFEGAISAAFFASAGTLESVGV